MTTNHDHAARTGSDTARLVAAWACAGLVPVAVLAGRAASIAFLEWRGYPQSVSEPPGLGMVAFGLIAVIVLVPTIAAVVLGIGASRSGRPAGLGAAATAGVIGGGLVLLGLPLFLSRLIGWPIVLVVGALLAAGIAAVVVRRRRGAA